MSISPDTVLEILSTIYYKAMWRGEFRTDNTTQETFHGTKGDTTVDMMHKTDMMGRILNSYTIFITIKLPSPVLPFLRYIFSE